MGKKQQRAAASGGQTKDPLLILAIEVDLLGDDEFSQQCHPSSQQRDNQQPIHEALVASVSCIAFERYLPLHLYHPPSRIVAVRSWVMLHHRRRHCE